jgi:hypothetical protein
MTTTKTVTPAKIAREVGVDPRTARQRLRKAIEAHMFEARFSVKDTRWEFPARHARKLKAIISHS